MPTFKFYGVESDKVSNDYLQLKSVQPNLAVKEYSAVSLRSGNTEPVTIEAANDDLVVMQMTNGVEWHYRADDFEVFLKTQTVASRGVETGQLMVPLSFSVPGESRGLEEQVVTKGITVLTGLVAKGAAWVLANKMESDLNLGLHGLNEKFELLPYNAKAIVKNKPYLLFIHGTNSNIKGAFKDLLTNGAFSKLYEYYEGRVIAYEHKTLSESPLKNVTDLLNLLPADIILDVVSHSRGGIVADLLARCSNGELPFNTAEMALIKRNNDFEILRTEAAEANKAAAAKNITVAKLVRVACPSAGTVVIDKRLDTLVNVLCVLLKLIPGAAACMPFTIFLDFAKAVVHERTDVDVFPGLAAQIPGSPLVRVLNNPNRVIKSELFVISGDVEASGIWKTILVASTNTYFGEAHDLVVNSNSMFKGTYRSTHVKERFEQQSGVNHFNYFKNKTSQDALLTALTEEDQWSRFYEDIGMSEKITTFHKRGITGDKPAVFILPGIMGSNLNAGDNRLWVNFIGLATGVLGKLRIDATDITAPEVHPETYHNLMNYLAADFDVIPFPYDWRQDLTEAGKRLSLAVEAELSNPKRTNKTIHFIAHSMGGLVLRSMIKTNPELWKNVTSAGKPRVLMMGVPNEGAFATIRILLGKDSTIKRLALLDFKNSKKQLLDIFRLYPGLAQLLPARTKDVFLPAFWNQLKDANNEYTGVPAADTLQKAADFYQRIGDTAFSPEVFRYIAGHGDNTPDAFTIVNNKIVFTSSQEGDGTVLWNTIPATITADNIYYVAADHGSIPKATDAFDAFKELLVNGKTELTGLSRIKPSTRGVAAAAVMPDSDPVTIPTDAELNETLLRTKKTLRKKTAQKITVSIINGDLAHAAHPVVVGHFKGDGIVEAEKILNRKLNNYLSVRHASGNYPDNEGTHEIVIRNAAKPRGAIVVGLGDFGELSENILSQTLKQAFLSHIIKNAEENKEMGNKPLGVSYLLIGTGFGGLSIYSSVKALLNAVKDANAFFDPALWPGYTPITEIEIVELYQQKSIQTGRIMRNLIRTNQAFSNISFIPDTIRKASGARNEIPDEMQTNWWQRLKISCEDETHCNGVLTERTLVFNVITDKAANDEKRIKINTNNIDSLIALAASSSNQRKELYQTLYELLIPNEFKGYGNDLRNMVLILDKETATYPWEMLMDAYSSYEEPLATKTGLLRQFSTVNTRQNKELSYGNNALVIGNPSLNGYYPELPAAGKEAADVAVALEGHNYQVKRYINEPAADAILHLYSTAYKILHIAAHGVLKDKTTCQTGVVLGEAVIITPSDFKQMRKLPELVFINCCSLAASALTKEQEEVLQRKYQVAGSIGTQLIEMGVKAVIVAGWEVNDGAAGLFSQMFYQQMLDGKTFGNAVAAAREQTFRTFPYSNTWGAYQCYGDPFYTLRGQGNANSSAYVFCDVVEAVNKLQTLVSEIQTATSHDEKKWMEEEIDRINEGVNKHAGWKNKAALVELYAEYYKETGQGEKAIAFYERLFGLEDALFTVKTVEQYCNVKAKQAEKDYQKFVKTNDGKPAKTKAQKDKARAAAVKIIDEVIDRLSQISKPPTSERYNLIASAYRRKSNLYKDSAPAAFMENLLLSATNYFNGYKLTFANTGNVYYYPFYNWLIIRLMADNLATAAQKNRYQNMLSETELANIEKLKPEAAAFAASLDKTEPDFWHKTAPSMQYLYELADAGTEADINRHRQEIANNHREAWATEGSVNKQNAIAEHARFIKEMLIKIAAQKSKGNTIKLIQQKIAAMEALEKLG